MGRTEERILKEKIIEKKFVKAVKEAGGIAPKLICLGFDGMPDRIVLLPCGGMGFVEVKAPGKVPRPLQASRRDVVPRPWNGAACNSGAA